MENFNLNRLLPFNGQMQGKEVPPQQEENTNCFEEDSWTTNAADAINKEFSNMDDFLKMYQESTQG